MKVIVEICVIPLSGKISLREEIAQAHSILLETGLNVELHGYGSNIEGDYDTIMQAVKKIHETLHHQGTPRIHTSLKIGSRTDKEQTLADKINAVSQLLPDQE